MKPPIFEMSADTRFIRQKLRTLNPGETITYVDLGKEIGKTIAGSFSALQSAIKSLLREGMVFSTVRNEGVMRLNDQQIVRAAEGDIKTLRRRARKSSKKLLVADYQVLSPAEQLSHTAKLSIMASVSALTTDKALQKIEKAAEGKSGELPIAQTIAALGYKL